MNIGESVKKSKHKEQTILQYDAEDLAKTLLNLDLGDCQLETLVKLTEKILNTFSKCINEIE